MCNEFEYILVKSLMSSERRRDNEQVTMPIKNLNFEYRNFLDRFAVDSIVKTFDDILIVNALLVLPRVERIILTFKYIFNMEIYEIANILDVDIRTIYVQKGTAIRRLKRELENEKNCWR